MLPAGPAQGGEVVGSRKRRSYDQPATSFERLKASGQVERTGFAALENFLASLDPFALKQAIETKLRAVLGDDDAFFSDANNIKTRAGAITLKITARKVA